MISASVFIIQEHIMSVNSHIQIPNGILKHFRAPHGKVYHLDLNTGRIRSCGSGTLGTVNGYYSDDMEKYLNKEIETPFTTLATIIISYVKGKEETLVLPITTEDTCKKYVTAAMSRSQLALDEFQVKSRMAFLYDSQTKHDVLVFLSTMSNGGIAPILQNLKMIIVINQTDRQFVVPRNCFYRAPGSAAFRIVIPIAPVCAIELVSEEIIKKTTDGRECRVKYINDPKIIGQMNMIALKYEYIFNHSFVASASKQELMHLQSYLDENKR